MKTIYPAAAWAQPKTAIYVTASACHLNALHQAARKHGLKITTIIFAPELKTLLLKTPSGSKLEKTIQFSTRPPWVRHDEHYHVDFENPDNNQSAVHANQLESQF